MTTHLPTPPPPRPAPVDDDDAPATAHEVRVALQDLAARLADSIDPDAADAVDKVHALANLTQALDAYTRSGLAVRKFLDQRDGREAQ